MVEVKYQLTHEWVKEESNYSAFLGIVATVGISPHAAEQLGKILYVELPELGEIVKKGDIVCNVESAKAVGDVITPYSGEIVEINEILSETPEAVSNNALGTFLFKVEIRAPSEGADLLTEDNYKATL